MRCLPLLALALLTACTGKADGALDTDGDGTPDTIDCAPDNPAIHPGATETCNDVDDDCDGQVDNHATDGVTYYGDGDGDGYPGDTDTLVACAVPPGYGSDPLDCDDTNPLVYPGADEACDLVDSDCDGELGSQELDADGDGFAACEDCDDTRATVFPGADEYCNDVDDDCDGSTDEGAPWFPDGDSDGYGDETASAVLADCDAPPPGHVADASDCDDLDAAVSPAETEVCDDLDVDEDCDGLSDDDDDSATGKTDHAPDADGDGYGDEHAPVEAWCDAPSGMVADASDCDDDDASVHPGASESGVGLWEDPACDGPGGSLARADVAFIGEGRNDYAGLSVHSAGDVDGDGLDDLIIGAYGNSAGGSSAGRSYLVFASTLVASSTTAIDLDTADVAFTGATGDCSGIRVRSAGDVDGDSLDDLIIGAYCSSDAGTSAGKAYLILASSIAARTSANIDLSDADVAFLGEESADFAGLSVSSAGDVDGDGRDDLLIGAYGNDEGGLNAGKSYLILASSLAARVTTTADLRDADFVFVGEANGDSSGLDANTAGDVDGDGLDDLLIGAHYNGDGGTQAGKAYLILASSLAASTATTINLSDADVAFIGENSYDSAGHRARTAGDVDGDGRDDLLIGAYRNDDGSSNAGKAYLILASSIAARTSATIDLVRADVAFIGEVSGDNASTSVGTAGDVDGDGLDDLLIAAHQNSESGSNAGKVYLLLASSIAARAAPTIDLSDADFAATGETFEDYAGVSVSTAGDVDGDGLDDLLIGAYGNDDGGSGAGKSYLIYSPL